MSTEEKYSNDRVIESTYETDETHNTACEANLSVENECVDDLTEMMTENVEFTQAINGAQRNLVESSAQSALVTDVHNLETTPTESVVAFTECNSQFGQRIKNGEMDLKGTEMLIENVPALNVMISNGQDGNHSGNEINRLNEEKREESEGDARGQYTEERSIPSQNKRSNEKETTSSENEVVSIEEDKSQKKYSMMTDEVMEKDSFVISGSLATNTVQVEQETAEISSSRKEAVKGITAEITDKVSRVFTDIEWVDILGNGLLKKKVLVRGKGEETRPKLGNEVTMIVNGELMDGTKLEEGVMVFIHGDRESIQAFEIAVALMEVEEKSVLYTDSKYAYGPYGCESLKIPKNCNITYTLEVVSVTEGPDMENMSDEARIEIGDKKRDVGNRFYSRGDYGSAIETYKRALKYLDGSSNKDVIGMKVKCQNNLSAAQLKVNAYQAALQSCNSVLTLQSGNIKAIFRKSKCLEVLGKQEEALKYLKEASMLDPNNKMIYNELMRLGKHVKQSRQQESDMYKRMVGKLQSGDKTTEAKKESNFPVKLLLGTLAVAGLGILAGFIFNRH